MQRLLSVYESAVWLNPIPDKHWEFQPSVQMMRQLFSDRMYPLTLAGIDRAMSELRR